MLEMFEAHSILELLIDEVFLSFVLIMGIKGIWSFTNMERV